MLAGTIHKLSTAATKPSALPAFRSVSLLNVLKSTFAGADPQAGTPRAPCQTGAFAAS